MKWQWLVEIYYDIIISKRFRENWTHQNFKSTYFQHYFKKTFKIKQWNDNDSHFKTYFDIIISDMVSFLWISLKLDMTALFE